MVQYVYLLECKLGLQLMWMYKLFKHLSYRQKKPQDYRPEPEVGQSHLSMYVWSGKIMATCKTRTPTWLVWLQMGAAELILIWTTILLARVSRETYGTTWRQSHQGRRSASLIVNPEKMRRQATAKYSYLGVRGLLNHGDDLAQPQPQSVLNN